MASGGDFIASERKTLFRAPFAWSITLLVDPPRRFCTSQLLLVRSEIHVLLDFTSVLINLDALSLKMGAT